MSDDIERIPSMRKPTRQGVPKRKPRELAKPVAPDQGKTRDAPQIAPRIQVEPPTPPIESKPMAEIELRLEPEPAPGPAPQREPEPVPETAAAVESAAPAEWEVSLERPPLTLREMLARVDAGWAAFRALAFRYPAEHMDDHLAQDGWTRKQMLAHIAAWHDLTADRLVALGLTGKPAPLERDVDTVNARAARVAIGKTAGEVLKDVESTFNRLRRQMLRLNDAQLRLGQGWAAMVIAGNTYEHYAEHIAELTPPEPPPGSGARR